MPSSFPTALDSFSNPGSTDQMDDAGLEHDLQHTNANDAVEALEAKVGIDGSADPTSLDARVADLETAGSDHGSLAGLLDDDHTQYQKESEKGAANGYASLDSSGFVPDGQLAATIARDSEITSAVSTHEAAGDPHPGYQTPTEHTAIGDSAPHHAASHNLFHADHVDVDDTDTPIESDILQYISGQWKAVPPSSGSHPDLATHDGLGLATDTELAAHTGDTTDAHDASAISFVAGGTIAATNVQAAIEEVAAEGASHPDLATHDALGLATDTELSAHTGDTSDAHDASAISVLDAAAQITATDVEGALAEIVDAAQAHDAAADPHAGYRLESADHSHASAGLQGGTIDHGALTGLTDDDHTQYAKETERLIRADFSKAGTLVTGTGTFRWYNDSGVTLTLREFRISVGTAPTGAAIICDLNNNGTTVFSTQSNRPQIAASANTGSTSTFNDTTIADGEYLTVDIDQIGSTIAGADLTAQAWMSLA